MISQWFHLRIPKTGSENLAFLIRHLSKQNNFRQYRWLWFPIHFSTGTPGSAKSSLAIWMTRNSSKSKREFVIYHGRQWQTGKWYLLDTQCTVCTAHQHWNNTLPRGGMYWKIRPPTQTRRLKDLRKQVFCREVQNPCWGKSRVQRAAHLEMLMELEHLLNFFFSNLNWVYQACPLFGKNQLLCHLDHDGQAPRGLDCLEVQVC